MQMSDNTCGTLYAESLSNQHKIIYIDITFVYGKVSLFCSLVFLHMCE